MGFPEGVDPNSGSARYVRNKQWKEAHPKVSRKVFRRPANRDTRAAGVAIKNAAMARRIAAGFGKHGKVRTFVWPAGTVRATKQDLYCSDCRRHGRGAKFLSQQPCSTVEPHKRKRLLDGLAKAAKKRQADKPGIQALIKMFSYDTLNEADAEVRDGSLP